MASKKFGKFVWEEEVQALGMPHFFLGRHLVSKFVPYFYILSPAFIFLGIGSVLSIIVLICEKVFSKHLFLTVQIGANLPDNLIMNKTS